MQAAYGTQGNFFGSTADGLLTVLQALSSTTASDVGGTYDGATAFAATSSVSGAGTITGAALLDYFDTTTNIDLGNNAPVNAGDYLVTASYAGDVNHTGSSASAAFTVAQASSTTTTTGAGPFTYTGSARSAVRAR